MKDIIDFLVEKRDVAHPYEVNGSTIVLGTFKLSIEHGEYGYYIHLPYVHHIVWNRVKELYRDEIHSLPGLIMFDGVACPEFEDVHSLLRMFDLVAYVVYGELRKVFSQ